jgi:very-short-patch-repair endonuclease
VLTATTYNEPMYRHIQNWIRRRRHIAHPHSVRTSTPEARALGELLRGYGWDVELEKWDGHKHIDIAIVKCKVNIEVDGFQHNYNAHQALADLERTYYSFKKGYATLRIPNVLVHDGGAVALTASYIDKFLRVGADQLEVV